MIDRGEYIVANNLCVFFTAEEPKSSKGCPRANGYYRHYDEGVCDKFINCVEGVANEMPCPPGLIYDDSTSSCAWSTDSKRQCTSTKKGTATLLIDV